MGPEVTSPSPAGGEPAGETHPPGNALPSGQEEEAPPPSGRSIESELPGCWSPPSDVSNYRQWFDGNLFSLVGAEPDTGEESPRVLARMGGGRKHVLRGRGRAMVVPRPLGEAA